MNRNRLVVCRRCGRSVAAGASVCPHCDHRRRSKTARTSGHALITVPLRILVGCALLSLAVNVYA